MATADLKQEISKAIDNVPESVTFKDNEDPNIHHNDFNIGTF